MAKSKVAAKVQQTAKPSLAQMLKEKQEFSSKYRVAIPVENLLNFDPQNPVTETVSIFGQPRKVLRWNISIDGKPATAVLMVGQVARLYQAILEESLPEGVSLEDKTQSVVILTDKFTTDSRNRTNSNGSAGFLNLTPFTRSNAEVASEVTGFQFSE